MFFNNDDDDEDDDFGGEFKPIDQLLSEFQKAKRGEKNVKLDEEELEFLIDYFFSLSEKDNVKAAFEIGTTMFPFSSIILLRKAEWLIEQTKFGQALKTLDDVDLIDPHNLESLFFRIDILTDTNHQLEAINILEENLEFYEGEDKCDILIEISEIFDSLEEYELVYKTLKRILDLDPQHEEAMLRICFWSDITNNQEDSIILYNKVLEENPFNTVAWYNLGVAYQGLKFFEKAVEAYITCMDLDEKFEYAYRNLGDAYIQLKQFDKAIEILEKHISMGTPEDVILEAIAFCWEKKKNYSLARNFYRQASQLNPEDDQIFFKIGETYTKEMEWEKAIKNYSLALHLNKNNTMYCLALANCLMEMNSYKEALILYLNAVRLKPSIKSTWLALVKSLYMLEYFDDGLAQLKIAEELCGEKPEFIYYKSVLYLALGKTKDAVLLLENALHQAPKKLNVLSILDKEISHHPIFVDVISKFKKNK